MANLTVKLDIVPGLNIEALNALLSLIKSSLGELGKNIQLIDPKVFEDTVKQYEASMNSVPAPKVPPPVVPPPDPKPAEDSGQKAGEGFKQKFLAATQGIQGGMNSIMGTILGVFGGNVLTGGIKGIVGSFEGILEKGKASMEATEGLSIAFAQAGKTGEQLNATVKETGGFAVQLAKQFALPIGAVRSYSQTAAAIGGATGQANKDLTMLAIGVEKASNGMISGEMAIRLFSKGVADPESQFALGRLTKQFPALAAALKDIKDPAQASQKALSFFAPTFKQMEEVASGPLGSMQRLDISLGQIKSSLGEVVIEGVAPFITAFANNIIPVLQTVVGGITSFIQYVKPLAPLFMAVGGAAAFMVMALLGLQGLKFIGGLASSATQFGLAILQKVIPALVVQDIATKSMIFNTQALNFGTLKQIAVDSIHTAALGIKSAALWVATAAQWAWNAALNANPISLIIIGIIALIAGIAALIIYFDDMGTTFKNVMGVLLLGIFPILGAFILLYTNVEKFRNFIQDTIKYISALFAGTWSFIKSIFGGGGTSAGEAFRNGFNKSMNDSNWNDAKKGVEKAFKEGTEVNVKVKASTDFGNTLEEYKKHQNELAGLQAKKSAGTLTDDEAKQYDNLTGKVNQLKGELAKLGPDAKTNIQYVVDANGNLVETFDLNIEKLQEMQTEQAKSSGADQASAVKKYSDSLNELTAKYDDQKKYLSDLKRQMDATNDPEQKKKLAEAYNEENKKIETNKKALVDSLNAGMNAGLVTADSIRKVATELGITETQAREMVLAKALRKASDEGKLTQDMADQLGVKFGVSHEKVVQNVQEIQKAKDEAAKTKKELMGWSDALDQSKKKFNDARTAIIQAAMDLKSGKITQDEYNKKETEYTKNSIEANNEMRSANETVNGLRNKGVLIAKVEDETAAKAADKAEKQKSNAKSAFELAKERYELQKKSLEGDLEATQNEDEQLRIYQGRVKNVYDEMNANKQKLDMLEEEKTKLQELEKLITKDTKGNIIAIKGVKKEDVDKVAKDYIAELNRVNKDITSTQGTHFELQTKINVDPLETAKKLNEIDKQNLELRIKLGLAKPEELLPLLKIDIDNAQKVLDGAKANELTLKAKLETKDGPLTDAEKKALDDAAQKTKEAGNNLLKVQEDLRLKKLEQQDKELKAIEDFQKKREDLQAKQIESEKRFADAFIKTFNDNVKQQLDAQSNAELKQLDKKFGKAQPVDPKEEEYNRQKQDIEAKHQRKLLALQSASQTLQHEKQRQADLDSLKSKQETESAKLAAMDKNLDPKAYNDQLKIVDDLNNKVKEKGDLLTEYGGQLTDSMGEIFGNLFAGNEEGVRQSAAKLFGGLGAILKKQLTITVTSQLLQTLSVSGPYAWIASAAIGAVIYAALSAIVDPIINGIASFATGGRVDSPTLALIGDATKAGQSKDTEWITRDVDIQAIVYEAIGTALAYFQSSTTVPAYMAAALTPFQMGLDDLKKGIQALAADALLRGALDSTKLEKIPADKNDTKSALLTDISSILEKKTLEIDENIKKLDISSVFFEKYQPETIMDSAELRNFMSETLSHQNRLENLTTEISAKLNKLDSIENLMGNLKILDNILGAVKEQKEVYIDGTKVTDIVNRRNLDVAGRSVNPFR